MFLCMTSYAKPDYLKGFVIGWMMRMNPRAAIPINWCKIAFRTWSWCQRSVFNRPFNNRPSRIFEFVAKSARLNFFGIIFCPREILFCTSLPVLSVVSSTCRAFSFPIVCDPFFFHNVKSFPVILTIFLFAVATNRIAPQLAFRNPGETKRINWFPYGAFSAGAHLAIIPNIYCGWWPLEDRA